MKQILYLVILYCSFSPSAIFAQQETIVKFQIKNFGMNVNGGFDQVSIQALLDLKQLQNSSINGQIQVESINTGNNKRDTHLRSDDYFEVETYPTIYLKSTRILKISSGKYTMNAELTVKKITKKVIIPLDFTDDQK